MLRGYLQSATTPGGGYSECVHLRRGPRSGLAPSCFLQDFLQSQNLRFRDEHTGLPVRACLTAVPARIMDHRFVFDIELETEAGNAFACPTPKRRFTDALDDLHGLTHVVETVAVAVDIGCGLLHPHKQRNSEEDFKLVVRRSNRSP